MVILCALCFKVIQTYSKTTFIHTVEVFVFLIDFFFINLFTLVVSVWWVLRGRREW